MQRSIFFLLPSGVVTPTRGGGGGRAGGVEEMGVEAGGRVPSSLSNVAEREWN